MGKILSVSIAAYNIEKYIDNCLSSFCDTSYNNDLEVLIVDDGSTDSTSKIAKKYENKYPSIIRYIPKKNGGWGSTINRGILEATGKFFKQLDGDDYFLGENLKNFIQKLKETDADIVYTNFATYLDGKKDPFEKTDYSSFYEVGKKYFYHDIINLNIIPEAMHTMTIKTDLLKQNYNLFKLTEHCFYTDVEYWIKSHYLANSFCYFDSIIYMYRVGEQGQSVSIQGIRKHYREHQKVLANCIQFIKTHELNKEKEVLLKNRLKTMAANQYEFYLCLPVSNTSKKELKQFDIWLKNEMPDIIPLGWKRFEILNKTKFILYPIAAKYVQKRLE